MIEIQDKGFTPEQEMVAQMWPGGKQPVTQMPLIEKVNNSRKEKLIKITCQTEGASLAYKIGDSVQWLLYTQEIKLPKGQKCIAKAIRYGYKPSEEANFTNN